MSEKLCKEAINNLLRHWDFIDRTNFNNLANNELMDVCIGLSPTLKKSYKNFILHCKGFIKEIATEKTI